jgi:hypothetical protein
MFDVFLTLLQLSGIFVLLIGMMTVFSWALPIKAPADKSNRINRIRLWWFAISAPHRFTGNFKWLYGDEVDNLKDGHEWPSRDE